MHRLLSVVLAVWERYELWRMATIAVHPTRNEMSDLNPEISLAGLGFINVGFWSMTFYHLLSLGRLYVWVLSNVKILQWKINQAPELTSTPFYLALEKEERDNDSKTFYILKLNSLYTSISGMILPSNTTGQSNRKHTETRTNTESRGRIWLQQPQTIKGVKVLPFLNCSRVHKMGTKTPALPSPSQKRRDEQKERELRLPPPPLTVTKRPLSDARAGRKGLWAEKAAELTKLTHEPS